jgi:ectoine hydroxylase-related dioxygenase (phytanoyl-CoA dioxygenase family)
VRQDPRIAAAVAALEERGYAIVEGLAEPAAMGSIAEELAPHFEAIAPQDRGNATARIHSRVLDNAPTLQQRLIDPVVSGVMERLLGPNCVRWQLSSVQGIAVHPGAADQGLHRDDDIFRLPHPHPVFEVNVMWAVTGFTAANGATRIVPGSHLWPSGQKPEPGSEIAAEMPAGSALFWLGSTWHGAGANRSGEPRIGFYAGYSLGWLRQEEMMYLALPPETVAPMPEVLQRLIGYELKGSMTLGWLDGRDPRKVLGLDG